MKLTRTIAGSLLALSLVLVMATGASAQPTGPKYQIKWGDTLWALSQRYHTTVRIIAATNNIPDPNFILAGSEIVIWEGMTGPVPVPGTAAPQPALQPAPQPAPVPAPTVRTVHAAPAVNTGGGGLGGVWACIRQHESGGNYSINTGNGYYGAYQFALGTWRSLGGTGLPSNASPAEQDAMAQKLQAQSGWGPWPNTSRMCGA